VTPYGGFAVTLRLLKEREGKHVILITQVGRNPISFTLSLAFMQVIYSSQTVKRWGACREESMAHRARVSPSGVRHPSLQSGRVNNLHES